jgi:hypothetical protein
MKYDKYELLELFESEPKVIVDELTGIFDYKRTDAYGFTLNLYISVHNQFCSLSLSYKDYKTFIFDIGFNNVESIQRKDDRLIVQQTNTNQRIVVYFKPNYALEFEDRSN